MIGILDELTNPQIVEIDSDRPDIMHIVCECNDDVAFCGERIDGEIHEWRAEGDDCVVCVDLEKLPCRLCGSEHLQ